MWSVSFVCSWSEVLYSHQFKFLILNNRAQDTLYVASWVVYCLLLEMIDGGSCSYMHGLHKGCPHKFENFRDPHPPVHAYLHIWFTTPSPTVRADTRLALFETLQLVNNSYGRVNKGIILILHVHTCVPIRQFRFYLTYRHAFIL